MERRRVRRLKTEKFAQKTVSSVEEPMPPPVDRQKLGSRQ